MHDYMENMQHEVVIPCEKVYLDGLLYIPQKARGMIIFAHGSGSSRFSSRNQAIAKKLQYAGFATLLFDLLTSVEDQRDETTAEYRFNIKLLASRLLAVTNWLLTHSILKKLPIGYFGASTGGGAALLAAAQSQNIIKAIVSRGGRPDLAGDALANVKAATLLIVGGDDDVVIQLNKTAFAQLHCEKELTIIPGATHLFEEPGKLDEVSCLAEDWFVRFLF